MRALSLCQSCKRHIRVTESACPFCGAAFTPAPEARGLKPRGRPGGRAALFLAGAASVPGCAEEQPVEEQTVPVYGVAIDSDAAPLARDGGAASDASQDARGPMVVPVYGIPVYGVPADRDGAADANVCGDPAPQMALPVYGVAIDSGVPRDAGACGRDAGTTRDAGPMRDSEIIALPPYGVGIDPGNRRDASTRDGEVLGVPVYGLSLVVEPDPEE